MYNICVMCGAAGVLEEVPDDLAIPDEYDQEGPICELCVCGLEEKYNDLNW